MIAKSCSDDAPAWKMSFSSWMNLLQQSLLLWCSKCLNVWTSMLTLNCFMAISSSAKSCFWSFSSICWAPPKDVLVEDKMLTAEATLTLLNRNIKLEKIKENKKTKLKIKLIESHYSKSLIFFETFKIGKTSLLKQKYEIIEFSCQKSWFELKIKNSQFWRIFDQKFKILNFLSFFKVDFWTKNGVWNSVIKWGSFFNSKVNWIPASWSCGRCGCGAWLSSFQIG